MNSSVRIAFLTGTFAVAGGFLSAKDASTIDLGKTLSIRVDDQAGLTNSRLRLATAETDRLFRAAKFRIQWNKCSPPLEEDQGIDMTSRSSGQPDHRGYILVRILRATPASVAPGALGFALPFAHRGAHVLIFYDRAEALARALDAPLDLVLGHAMAHEIAHVLMRSPEHSTGGMMQACWTAASWRLASQGLLTFRHEEIEKIRRGFEQISSFHSNEMQPLVLASSAHSR